MGPNKYPLYKVYMGLIIKGPIPRGPPAFSPRMMELNFDCYVITFCHFKPYHHVVTINRWSQKMLVYKNCLCNKKRLTLTECVSVPLMVKIQNHKLEIFPHGVDCRPHFFGGKKMAVDSSSLVKSFDHIFFWKGQWQLLLKKTVEKP